MATTEIAIKNGKPKLIWLFFMHRHGDRSPLNMGSKDKYNDLKYWPEGFGNLDNPGRLRMYKLGKFIRRKYEHFLTDSFREVYSRSSDVERCIESSNAVLAGMYPPSDRFKWSSELPWTPPAVHTCPVREDYLLNEAGTEAVPVIQEEIRLIQKSEQVKELYEESVEERKLLEKELGLDYDSFCKFKCTYSTLDIEERNGLEMPAWYNPELKKRLYKFAAVGFALAGGGTERLQQVRCGRLFEDIIQRMQLAPTGQVKHNEKSDFQQPTNAPSEIKDRKVVHYSTHDSIMAAVLESLRINSPPVAPGFGATLFIELYVDVDGNDQPISEKYLKILYMDDTESEVPVEKVLPGCKLNDKSQLTLNAFVDYVQHLLPKPSN
uniref:acid phosphatase n=1 Tax=Aceria tosichella TaxID=561515 RepID=A0A6G1SKD2_9ACAR